MQAYFKFDWLKADPDGHFLQQLGLTQPAAAICGVKVLKDSSRSVKLAVFVDRDHPAFEYHDEHWLIEQIRNDVLRAALSVLGPVEVNDDLEDERTFADLLDRDIQVKLVSGHGQQK